MSFKTIFWAALCCLWLGWGAAHASVMPIPAAVQQTLNRDPQIAKAFAHGLKLLENRQWDASRKAWAAILDTVRAKYGEEHLTTGQAVIYLGVSLREQKNYTIALPFLTRGVNTFENHLGVHQATADAIESLSTAFGELGHHAKALPLHQRTLGIREKVLGPEHPDTVRSMNDLAHTYSRLAHHDKELPLKQQALAISEKVLGPEHPDTATSLNDLAVTYSRLAQHDKELPLQQRALGSSEIVLGPEHPDTVWSMNDLAHTYSRLAQHDKALPLQQRALAITEKVRGPVHPDTATSLNNLAQTYSRLAQYDKALPLQQRALAIYENKALPLQQRALAISEKVRGREHSDTARSLDNLAETYSSLAQHDKALPLQQRALAITEKVLGPEHPDTARSMNFLALTSSRRAQHDKDRPLQQRALAITEKVLGPEHPSTATSLHNLAVTYSSLAQHDKALPLQQRALAITEKVLGPEHPGIATSLNNLAGTYNRLTQHDMALPLQQRALFITENTLGPDHPDTAVRLHNLASSLRALNHTEAATALFKAAVNIFQVQREQVASIGAAELKSYSQSIAPAYQALASVLTDQGRLDEAQLVLDMLKEDEQFEFVRRSANADPRRSRMAFNATEQAWTQRYRQVADRLAALGAEEVALQKQAKLGLTAEQQQRQKALAADLAVARQAFQAFLDELRNSFVQKGPARAVEVIETSQKALRDLQALLKGLGDDAVLLQYYITDDKVGMLLTTPGVQLARSSQVNAKDLNRQIAEFRRLLRDPKSNPLPAAQALYQLLVAPVAQDLAQAEAKTVMLSLDGALRYVPFAALHDGQQYLAQKWNLPMYTSVTKDKLRDAVSQEWQAAALGLTQAVGEFDALPAVRAEMRGIVKDGRTGVLPGEVHLDKAFSAARLKDVSQRPFQLLHVASHFRFSPGTEVNSFLLLGDGQQLTLGDIRTQNFRFDQVDLLTLSACDTGLGGGRDAQGREIEGFGVIAQQQGAKAVLATLWPVADQSTALLMADLYKRRQSQRLTKIEALRQAQLGLMAQPRYAHPFYWAPFILMGNWK